MARGGARVHIYGDWDGAGVKKAQQDIGAFQKQAAGFSGAITKSMLGVGAAIGGAFAVGNIISTVTDYLRDAATAAMEDQKSMVALATAMENVGQGFANSGAEDFIKQMMLATGVADDELRPAFQRLVTATGDAAKSQGLLTTALDISAATGKDVVSVSQALARASTGQISALTRLGIPLDANIIKTKDFGAAVDSLNEKFGGQAAAAANTYAGQMKRVQTAAAEAQETIGYALLGAVDDISQSFGGAGGFIDVIDASGQGIANFITGIGGAVGELADMSNAVADFLNKSTGMDMSLGDLLLKFYELTPGVGLLVSSTKELAEAGAAQTAAAEAQARANDALSARYTAMAVAIDPTKAAIIGLADATDDAGEEMQQAKTAADSLKASLDRFTTKDEYISAVREMGRAAKEAKGDLVSTKDAAINLRSEFGNAASSLLTYAQAHGSSAAEVLRIWNNGVDAIKQKLIDKGVKPSDVEAFVNPTVWQTKFMLLADVIGRGRAAEAMRLAGLAAGKQAWQGMVTALTSSEARSAVGNASASLGNIAAGKLRQVLQISSPSRVFMEIGQQTALGLIAGMDSKKGDVAQKAAEIAQGLYDKAAEIIAKWDTRLSQLRGNLDQATADIANWVSSTSSALASAFDLKGVFEGSYDEQGNFVASRFQEGFTTAMNQFTWFTNVLNAIKNAGGSPELLAFIQSQGVAQGGAWGQALIDNGLVQYASDNLGTVQNTATTTAQAMVPPFLVAAQQQAQAAYDEFRAKYGKDGPFRKALMRLMDDLADKMKRTTTITVTTVYAAAGIDGDRAAGGPVTAGKAYLVGEQGPEILVMGSQSGTIIPNGELPSTIGASSSGGSSQHTTYSITVQAGVGDPRQIGQQVVEYIRRFEQANGNVFAAA